MRKGTRDKGAGTEARFEIAFRKELGIRRENGDAGDGEFRGERAGGGNLLSGGKIAANDRGAEGVVNLAMKRARGPAIDLNEWRECGRRFVHARDYSGHIELWSSGY